MDLSVNVALLKKHPENFRLLSFKKDVTLQKEVHSQVRLKENLLSTHNIELRFGIFPFFLLY